MKQQIKYEVIRDRQGGSFGMDRQYTADEWRKQAIEWLDTDGTFETEQDKSNYETTLAKMDDTELIEYIADMWDLEFKKV